MRWARGLAAVAIGALTLTGCGEAGTSAGATPDETVQETASGATTPAPPTDATNPPAPDALGGVHRAGSLTVTAVRCDLGATRFDAESSSEAMTGIAVQGDRVYLTDADGRVLRFAVEELTAGTCRLSLDPTWGEDGVHTPANEASEVSVSRTGRVLASGSVFGVESVDAGTGASITCSGAGDYVLAPDGTTGLGFFPGSPLKSISFTETSCRVEEPAPLAASLPFAEPTVTALAYLDGGDLLVGGRFASGDRGIARIARGGKVRWTHGDGAPSPQNFGWVHGVAPCGEGFCAVDTNFARLQVLGATGDWLTSVDLGETLGITTGAWIDHLEADDQGWVWLPVGIGRDGEDGADGALFVVHLDQG